jgi:bla regulator protein blaR1
MNSVAAAIGWSVVHSLWQGAVAALALGAVLFVTRSARARYAAACLALALMCIGFGATLWRSLPAGISGSVVVIRAEAPLGRDLGNGPALRNRADFASKAMPWIAAIWVAGVLVFQLRAVASWRAARRLRFTAVCAPPPPWQERLDALRARIRVNRAVKLLESGLAEAPAVVGHLRPIVLMPVG